MSSIDFKNFSLFGSPSPKRKRLGGIGVTENGVEYFEGDYNLNLGTGSNDSLVESYRGADVDVGQKIVAEIVQNVMDWLVPTPTGIRDFVGAKSRLNVNHDGDRMLVSNGSSTAEFSYKLGYLHIIQRGCYMLGVDSMRLKSSTKGGSSTGGGFGVGLKQTLAVAAAMGIPITIEGTVRKNDNMINTITPLVIGDGVVIRGSIGFNPSSGSWLVHKIGLVDPRGVGMVLESHVSLKYGKSEPFKWNTYAAVMDGVGAGNVYVNGILSDVKLDNKYGDVAFSDVVVFGNRSLFVDDTRRVAENGRGAVFELLRILLEDWGDQDKATEVCGEKSSRGALFRRVVQGAFAKNIKMKLLNDGALKAQKWDTDEEKLRNLANEGWIKHGEIYDLNLFDSNKIEKTPMNAWLVESIEDEDRIIFSVQDYFYTKTKTVYLDILKKVPRSEFGLLENLNAFIKSMGESDDILDTHTTVPITMWMRVDNPQLPIQGDEPADIEFKQLRYNNFPRTITMKDFTWEQLALLIPSTNYGEVLMSCFRLDPKMKPEDVKNRIRLTPSTWVPTPSFVVDLTMSQ